MMRRALPMVIGFILVAVAAIGAVVWFSFRIYVPEDQCAVLIRKMGAQLPAGEVVASEPDQKGIQAEVLGPGRHFRNPVIWDYELTDLTVIPTGDPRTWEWVHSLDDSQRNAMRAGRFKFKGDFPRIGVVTRKVGGRTPQEQVVVSRESGMQGILAEVLTPGVYKINPYIYEVEIHPAVVIPAGFVGVVTNLFGETPQMARTPELLDFSGERGEGETEGGAPATDIEELTRYDRPLAESGQRGTQRDVLQPGVYFINPRLQKVTLIEVGFNEYSQVKVSESQNDQISFPSDTGYDIKVGATVVWGIHPAHAAQIINEFGNVDRVLDKVIGPQLRSICRNIGSTYAARDFIQGEKRELFQRDLTAELQRVARKKNLEVLLSLIREIEVHAPVPGKGTTDATEDLKRTIQESFIAIENQLTKEKQRDAAAVKAKLEEERKKVDIARETIAADTRVLVADILAEADKAAAEIQAQAQLDVATIQEEVAKLDARRTEILGESRADVERMKNEAEAKGYEMLVGALGSGQAYNLYTFAENFRPESIRMFFAGEGTFWTDLTRFEELGAAKLLGAPSPKPAGD